MPVKMAASDQMPGAHPARWGRRGGSLPPGRDALRGGRPGGQNQHQVGYSPAVLWNRSRNRRNRNFLTNGTGTVIIYGSGTGTRYKIFLFDFLHLTFYNKFDKTYQFFPCKKVYYVKRQDFFQIFYLFICFLWPGAGTVTAKSRNRNRSRNK
jgi:hypothetical protein